MKKKLVILCVLLVCLSNGRSVSDIDIDGAALPVRAISLGGWLVTEGWIKPSLFEGIPNKDFLDGTRIQLKSVTVGKYLCAETGGGTIIVANRSAAYEWETFRLWRMNETSFNIRVSNKQFVGLHLNSSTENGIDLLAAMANAPSTPETFEIHINPQDSNRVRIKASNGFFLQVKTEELVTADYQGDGGWGDDNPSVFVLTITYTMQGEYQVTNGYGPLLAPKIMKDHWDTFIVEKDFKYIKDIGLNAVRIPVGWWIAHGPNPPTPYVGGSLQALDNAFSWAEKYGINVIFDLHCAPGSQSGWEHTSSRDGFQEWGQSDDNIQETVGVIDFLTARYAQRPSLLAVELLNEPLSPGVSLQNVTKYYKAAYDVVRKHSATAYVVLPNRVGPNEPRELFSLAQGMSRVVVDVHLYYIFSNIFQNLTAQQNIDYIYNNQSAQLQYLTTPDGPIVFVGEWVVEWMVENATKSDFQRFAKAQQQVYGKVGFGWAYWTLRSAVNNWSLEWMIKNGYIKI